MKIILFDPITTGHHIQYGLFLMDYFIECGDEVRFITWREDSRIKQQFTQEYFDRLEFVNKNSPDDFSLKFIKRLYYYHKGLSLSLKEAKLWGADVLHNLYFDIALWPLYFSRVLNSLKEIKIFGTLFQPNLFHSDDKNLGIKNKTKRVINKWVLKRIAKNNLGALFVHSDGIREQIMNSIPDKNIESLIKVIPDPVKENKCDNSVIARKILNLPSEEFLVLFFGGLRSNKGPDLLIDAARDLPDRVKIVIAGPADTEDKETMKQNLLKSKVNKDIILRLQFIAEEELPCYFRAADAVVLPYKKEFKGTSGVLQNAAAAGCPVIASNVGELGKIVTKYSLGIVVKPESSESISDAIRIVANKPESWFAQIRSNALEYAKEHHWRKMGAKVRETYQKIIET